MTRSRIRPVVLVLAGLAVAGGTAAAQDPDYTSMNLERLMAVDVDMVHGASRFLQKISEAPASITIVTDEEIRAFGYRTLTDILSSVRGFTVTDDRNYSYFGTRGLAVPGDFNSRMLVLIDGHRINDNIYDSILAGTEFPLDIDLIRRVEVIRGPGSAMYGANAFSAVINVITRTGAKIDGVEAAIDAGTMATERGRVTFGRRFPNGVDVVASASGYTSGGESSIYFPEFDSAATNHGIAHNEDRDQANRFMAAVSFGDIAIHALYGGRSKQIPTASYGTVFGDGREETFDGRGYVEAQYAREIGKTGDVLVRAYYDAYRYRGVDPVADGGVVTITNEQSIGDAVGSELSLSRQIGTRQRIAVGSELRFNIRQNEASSDSTQQFLDARHSSSDWALSAQDEIRLLPRVVASGALRFDHQSLFDGRLTPRASLVLGPFGRTHVKLLFADAFRAPSADNLYYDTPLAGYGNSTLQPETIRSYEVVAEHAWTDAFQGTASIYRTTLDNLILPSGLDSGELSNRRADVDGIEVGARFAPRPGVLGNWSYAYQHPRDAATAERLNASPRHLVKFNAMAPLFGPRLRAAFQVITTSSVETHTGERLPPSSIADVTLTTWNMWRRVDLGATLNNAFDAHARFPVSDVHIEGSVPQYGRRLTVRVTWRF